MFKRKEEQGQSIIIIAFIVLVLLALVALVVDVGNAYANRRKVQNAVDAAAMAGARELAKRDEPGVTHAEVLNAIEDFAERNGVARDDIEAWYTDIAGTPLQQCDNSTTRVPKYMTDPVTGEEKEVTGINVSGDLVGATYFAHLLGFDQIAVSARARGVVVCGACSAQNLFPVAFSAELFNDEPNQLPIIGKGYVIWDESQTAPGSTGYLNWEPIGTEPQGPNSDVLVQNMHDTSRSGMWSVGSWIPSSTGTMNSNGVKDVELPTRIYNLDPVSRPPTVTIPIYDITCNDLPTNDPDYCNAGSNLKYRAVGFAAFRITCAHYGHNKEIGDCVQDESHSSDKWFEGEFVRWVEPTGESGCADYGLCTAKERTTIDTTRGINGIVQYKDAMTEGGGGPPQPVDVVLVIDLSWSMRYDWDSTDDSDGIPAGVVPGYQKWNNKVAVRVNAAKEALIAFTEHLSPTLGDRAALVTYGKKITVSSGGKSYNGCDAELRQSLTGNMGTIQTKIEQLGYQSNTCTALGIKLAYEHLLANGDPTHIPVIILATDGMANVRLDKIWHPVANLDPQCMEPYPYRNTYPDGYDGPNYGGPYSQGNNGCAEAREWPKTNFGPPVAQYPAYDPQSSNDAVAMANSAKDDGIIIFTVVMGYDWPGNMAQINAYMKAIASPDSSPNNPHFFPAHESLRDVEMTDVWPPYPWDAWPWNGQDPAPEDLTDIYWLLAERMRTVGNECLVIPKPQQAANGATVKLYRDGALVATTTAYGGGNFVFTGIPAGEYELVAEYTGAYYYDIMTDGPGGPPLQDPPTVLVHEPDGMYGNIQIFLDSDSLPSCP